MSEQNEDKSSCDVCGEQKAQFYCPSCEQPNQCDDCSKFLHAKRARKDHKIYTQEEWTKQSLYEAKKNCTHHPKSELKLYCHTCTELVCLQCITQEHTGHVCQQIQEGMEPMLKLLNEKKEEFNSKKTSFETEIKQVIESKETILKETKESKEKLVTLIEELIQSLKKKEKDLLDEIDFSETPKITQLEDQQKFVEKNLTVTKEILSSIDSTLEKKDIDSFVFVFEGLERKKELENLVLKQTPGKPVSVPGSYKTLITKKQKQAINSLDLLPPIDFYTSTVISAKKCIMETNSWEHTVNIQLKNHSGYPLTLSREYTLYTTIEGPKDVEYDLVKTNIEGNYELKMKGDTLGDYKIRIYYKDFDLKGSPFHLKVTLPIPNTIDVPIQVSNIHSYYHPTKEYITLNKNTLKYFDTFNKSREIKLPFKPTYFTMNDEGEYFVVEGDKLLMYDKNLKEIWKVQLKEKVSGICLYFHYIILSTPKGPLLKYTLYGEYQSNLHLQTELNDTKGILFNENLFIIQDENIFKVFCIEGVLRQEIVNTESTSLCIIEHTFYYAPSNTKQWKKLILTPDWDKKSQPKPLLSPRGESKAPIEIPKEEIKTNSPRGESKNEGYGKEIGREGRTASLIEPKDSTKTRGFTFFGGIIGKSKETKPKSIQDADILSKIKNQGAITHSKLTCFCISPTGDVIFTASPTEIKAWDYQTGELIQTIQSGCKLIEYGINIYTYCEDKIFKIYKYKTGELIREFKVEEDIECFTLSLDSRKIYCGTKTGTFICYETTKEGVYNYGKHGDCILSIFASKDARFILTGSNDSTVKLWSTDGKDIKILKGHSGPVKSVLMSYDGSLIVSGSLDKTIRVYQNETFKLTKTIKLKDKLNSLGITPNGHYLITSSDGLRIFKVESGNEKVSIPLKESKNLLIELAGRYFICSEGDNLNIFQTTKFPDEQKKDEGKKKEEEKKEEKKDDEKKEEGKEEKKENRGEKVVSLDKESLEEWINKE